MPRTNFVRKFVKVVSTTTFNEEVTDALNRMLPFIFDGSFSKYKRAREVVGFLGVTRRGITAETEAKNAAEYMGISYTGYRKACVKVSDDLYELFGDDFFEKLQSSSEVDKRMLVARIDDVISGINVYDYVNPMIVSRVDVLCETRHLEEPILSTDRAADDFPEEWAFLLKYCTPKMMRDFNKCDPAKLRYIIDLLRGGNDNLQDRTRFIKLAETL